MEKRDKDQLDLESPLGLADEPIVKTDADHLSSSGDSSTRRRRARALGEDGIERRPVIDVDPDADGASGIDMGYGGDGTDVKPSR